MEVKGLPTCIWYSENMFNLSHSSVHIKTVFPNGVFVRRPIHQFEISCVDLVIMAFWYVSTKLSLYTCIHSISLELSLPHISHSPAFTQCNLLQWLDFPLQQDEKQNWTNCLKVKIAFYFSRWWKYCLQRGIECNMSHVTKVVNEIQRGIRNGIVCVDQR